jgi:hypothetical protein
MIRTRLAMGVAVVGIAVSGCGGSNAGATDAGTVCGSAMFLGQVLQEERTTPPTDEQMQQLQETIERMPDSASKAAAINDKYQTLEGLVGAFITSLEAGDSQALVDLRNLQDECQNLAGGELPTSMP